MVLIIFQLYPDKQMKNPLCTGQELTANSFVRVRSKVG